MLQRSDLAIARQMLDDAKLAFVIVRDRDVLAIGRERGVMELLDSVDRIRLHAAGASLADRIVGRAVAMIALDAGFVAVDTPLASHSAVRLLMRSRVPIHADAVVPRILNRTRQAGCPLEKIVRPYSSPLAATEAMRSFFAAQRGRACLVQRG